MKIFLSKWGKKSLESKRSEVKDEIFILRYLGNFLSRSRERLEIKK